MAKKVKQNTRRTYESTFKALTPEEHADLIGPFESVEADIEPEQANEYDPVDLEDRLFDVDGSTGRANRVM